MEKIDLEKELEYLMVGTPETQKRCRNKIRQYIQDLIAANKNLAGGLDTAIEALEEWHDETTLPYLRRVRNTHAVS